MRFERIEVSRFGKFADLSLDFPSGGLDFHLVVGPNEAGKSTVRAAIADLLFGIEARSRYAFAYDYAQMRLGAAVAAGELRRRFYRLKRAKGPLRDADDNPLKDDLLRPLLGEMDRVSYERMFCLDHERLVRGGDEILNAKDDVARLLFETSSGITSFGELRDALEAEAKALWDKRHSKDRAYHRAADEFKEADQRLKQATVRAGDWVEIEQRAQEAHAAFDAARREQSALERRRAQLERIRRVAPHLQKLRADREASGQLAGTALLPRNAREQLERAEMQIAAANARLDQVERTRQSALGRTEGISVDQACLERAAEIEALARQCVRTEPFERDIGAVQIQVSARLEEAQRLAQQLRWSGDERALEEMIPPQWVRASIQELVQEHGRRAQAVASASQAVVEKQNELDALAAQLDGLSAEPVSARLRAALAAVQSLGEPERRARELRARTEDARGRLARALLELQPWTGDLDALRAVALPADPEIRAHDAREQELLGRLKLLREQLQGAQAGLAAHELRERQLQEARRVVTAEELHQARSERDALWDRIRRSEASLESAADAFEAMIAEADRRADLRYAAANDVAVLEQTRAALGQQRLQCAQQQSAIEALARELESHRAEWSGRMQQLGLGALTALRFPDWSEQRRTVLALAETVAALESELQELETATRLASEELDSSLASAGAPAGDGDARGLSQLFAAGTEFVRRAEERRARSEALLQQRQAANAALASLRARADQARADMGQWEQAWAAQIAAAKLPPGSSPLVASQALETCAALAVSLREVRDLRRNRIEAMRRELETFTTAARRLAASLAPEWLDQPPDRIALGLEARLAGARRDADKLRDAREEVAQCEAEIADVRAQREQAEARIRPLMQQCGVGDPRALRDAIARSERLHELHAGIEQALEACRTGGDNLTVEQLEAELAAENVAEIPVQLARLGADLARLTEQQNERIRAITESEAALRRYDGQADAAHAEAQRQQARAAMAAALERYIKVKVAAQLLRWSIDRYREDRQAPLLKRASENFRTLTRGSFERLMVDFEERPPQLKGCRPGGTLVGVEGMSDGTRDQLYLALRLAALELQLDQGRSLPFVADDLFINFDDERAAAGFQALAELATQTQVIFLTHHAHLVPIVERTIGKPVSVVRL